MEPNFTQMLARVYARRLSKIMPIIELTRSNFLCNTHTHTYILTYKQPAVTLSPHSLWENQLTQVCLVNGWQQFWHHTQTATANKHLSTIYLDTVLEKSNRWMWWMHKSKRFQSCKHTHNAQALNSIGCTNTQRQSCCRKVGVVEEIVILLCKLISLNGIYFVCMCVCMCVRSTYALTLYHS